MKTKTLALFLLISIAPIALSACEETGGVPASDQVQHQQQEQLAQQANSSVGFPAIKNFREKRELKDIYEMRDQADLATFTYTYSEVTGKFKLFCRSIGFPIPYATQFTNPQKIGWSVSYTSAAAAVALPQADPNGLFSPGTADATWVLCQNPKDGSVHPTYVEPKLSTLLFELPDSK